MISKNTAAIDISLLEFRVTWSASPIQWSVVLWSAWKPNWLVFSKFMSSVCFWIVLEISFSNSLPVVKKMVSGHKFWRNSVSLSVFGRVMILFPFQSVRRWWSWRQWLNKLLIAQGVFLENAGHIHLECHQNHRHFLIWRIVFLFRH
jgi:hypothetical protein